MATEMSSISDTTYSQLKEDEKTSQNENNNSPKGESDNQGSSAEDKPSVDESSWTSVQSSSTKRRLAPQYSISRQDIGVDRYLYL